MANICDLEEWVLERIFNYIIKKPLRGISEWKSYLALLGVCQLWRDMLFHRIYRHAFVNYMSSDGSNESGDVPRTNIDLIVALGWHSFVNTLSIMLRSSSDFYDTMDFLINRYISKGGEWPSVFRLIIRFKAQLPRNMVVPHNSFSPDTVEQYRLLGKRFVKHLVDVRYMSFENQDMRVIPHSFASALVEAYSRNMNYLYCGNVVFPRAIVHLSGALTNLRIDFSGVSIDYFPSVISESLEELTLLELPDTFSMSHFAHHDQTRHIHFSNLKWLTLKYRQTDMEFDQAVFSQISNTKSHLYYKIQAPKLKVLILEHITPHCDMLYSLNGLRLETFYFTGSIQCLGYLGSQRFDVRRVFEINISDSTVSHDEQFYTTTNHYLSRFVFRRILGLAIGRLHDSLRMDLLRWRRLNHLQITESVSVATLLRLLSRLDNLTNLHVYNVTTNEAMDMIFENDMRVLAGMAPRSTRLISMYIKRQATHDALSHSQMMYIVKFLMANTPSLQRLGVLDEIMAEVKTFAEANSQHHPHLSGVRIFSAWPH